VCALKFPETYYRQLAADYAARREIFSAALTTAGFRIFVPEGAYYILAEIGDFGMNDVQFCDWLVREVGVAAVPGSFFVSPPGARPRADPFHLLQTRGNATRSRVSTRTHPRTVGGAGAQRVGRGVPRTHPPVAAGVLHT
jgi:hypothetical protein